MTFTQLLEALNKLGLLDPNSHGELKLVFHDPFQSRGNIEAIEIRDNELRFIEDYDKYISRLGYEPVEKLFLIKEEPEFEYPTSDEE